MIVHIVMQHPIEFDGEPTESTIIGIYSNKLAAKLAVDAGKHLCRWSYQFMVEESYDLDADIHLDPINDEED
jgi:hypothetical protein